MNKKNNHNSIVFLTTLSVYLGLVLVGGTAPVLAQAALTRDFDIKNEIVFEDDLDKKPNDDDEIKYLKDSLRSYYVESLNDLIQNLKVLQSDRNFDLNSDSFNIEKYFSKQCFFDSTITVVSEDSGRIDNRFLLSAIEETKEKLEHFSDFSDCFPNKRFDKTGARSSQTKIKLDEAELKIEISVEKASPQKAAVFLDKLNLAGNAYLGEVDYFSIERKNPLRLIYEHTSFKSENNQVFIVTRLPRASIDALLAEKDAQ